MDENEVNAFISGLQNRTDVAKHVRRAIWNAHYGRIPTMRAHHLEEQEEDILETAEWLRCPKRAPRFVVISWRKDGTRVRYKSFERLEQALRRADGLLRA